MSCKLCAGLKQLGLNFALLTDKALNTILAGDPNETVSQRTARAREAGQRWATHACAVLTWAGNLMGANRDHCTWALSPGSIGAEVWDWSPTVADPETSA
jgi:hypothetical protein